MTISDYKRLLDEAEAEWIDRLERHAEDSGKHLDLVLAEALVERHREAGELETANANLRATIARLTKLESTTTMAYAQHESARLALEDGLSDGTYRKISMNRKNAEPATARARRDLEQQRWHTNILTEAPVKALPDATVSF